MSHPNAPQQPSGYPPYTPPATGPAERPKHLRGHGALLAMWITLGIAIVLFVIGGIVLATKSLGQVNDFKRVSITAGSGTVELNGTGKWIGYYEAADVTDAIDHLPEIQVLVTDPTGQTVDIQPYGKRSDGKIDKLTYDYNGHRGAAAFEFTATEAGSYGVQVQPMEQLPPDAELAFGRDIAGGTIAGALLVVTGVAFLIAAIVLLIVGLVKRNRHKGELRSGAYYGQPAPFGAPMPGYAPPPSGYQPPPPGYAPPPQGYQPPAGYQPPPTGYEPPQGHGENPAQPPPPA